MQMASHSAPSRTPQNYFLSRGEWRGELAKQNRAGLIRRFCRPQACPAMPGDHQLFVGLHHPHAHATVVR
jgi:hypothetical protein